MTKFFFKKRERNGEEAMHLRGKIVKELLHRAGVNVDSALALEERLFNLVGPRANTIKPQDPTANLIIFNKEF